MLIDKCSFQYITNSAFNQSFRPQYSLVFIHFNFDNKFFYYSDVYFPMGNK